MGAGIDRSVRPHHTGDAGRPGRRGADLRARDRARRLLPAPAPPARRGDAQARAHLFLQRARVTWWSSRSGNRIFATAALLGDRRAERRRIRPDSHHADGQTRSRGAYVPSRCATSRARSATAATASRCGRWRRRPAISACSWRSIRRPGRRQGHPLPSTSPRTLCPIFRRCNCRVEDTAIALVYHEKLDLLLAAFEDSYRLMTVKPDELNVVDFRIPAQIQPIAVTTGPEAQVYVLNFLSNTVTAFPIEEVSQSEEQLKALAEYRYRVLAGVLRAVRWTGPVSEGLLLPSSDGKMPDLHRGQQDLSRLRRAPRRQHPQRLQLCQAQVRQKLSHGRLLVVAGADRCDHSARRHDVLLRDAAELLRRLQGAGRPAAATPAGGCDDRIVQGISRLDHTQAGPRLQDHRCRQAVARADGRR